MLGVRSNRFWICVFGALALLSAAASLVLLLGEADEAAIVLDGELINSISLSAVGEPYFITVESDQGLNVVAVEYGRIRVLEADCPDGSCVKQGWRSSGATPIVCLPHRLVIEFSRSKPQSIDAVT